MTQDNQNISPSELYAINFQNPEPKYYSRIPHLISYLTYDSIDIETGEKVVKKLSLKARELYRVLRMTAGDFGKCWRNTEDLAELCGMSAGSVSNAKDELIQKFHQTDGNPLIIIKEKKKKNKVNGSDYHEITITNIWPWNNAYMATMKYHTKKEADSRNERAYPADSPNEPAPQEAGSPDERNNNPINKTPLSKEQQSTAKADSVDSVSLNSQDSVSPDWKDQAYDWLTKKGCPEKNAKSIISKFSCKDISEASKYTDKQLKKNKAKGKPTENIWAYFQNVLNQRYWEKK